MTVLARMMLLYFGIALTSAGIHGAEITDSVVIAIGGLSIGLYVITGEVW